MNLNKSTNNNKNFSEPLPEDILHDSEIDNSELELNDLPPVNKKSTFAKVLTFSSVLLLALLILLVILTFVISPMLVDGDSMLPTIKDNEIVFVNKTNITPKYLDIVIYWKTDYSTDRRYKVIKRCIGLPGDTIQVLSGLVYKNGILLEEEYTNPDKSTINYDPIVLGEDEYFMLGDNRKVSKDSRYYGAVNIKDIVGIML